MDQFTVRQVNSQITVPRHLEFVPAAKMQGYNIRIGARRDNEIIFESTLPSSIIDQVDSRIDLAIAHPGVRWNPRPPFPWIVPDQVVADAGQPFFSHDCR